MGLDGRMDGQIHPSQHMIFLPCRKRNEMLYLFMIATVSSIAILIPVLKNVRKSNEDVFSLFLMLTDAEIKTYNLKCERFKKTCKIVFHEINVGRRFTRK